MGKVDNAELVLDTDVVIDYLRRKSALLLQATARYECALTAVTYYELLAVPTLSSRQETLLHDVVSYMPILSFNSEAAQAAAEIWRTLQGEGMLIGVPDTLIAGICLAHNLPLLTMNLRHHGRVPHLKLISHLDI